MTIEIAELIDPKKIDSLLISFTKTAGLSAAIVDLEGIILSQHQWRSLYHNFYINNPETAKWLSCVSPNAQIQEGFNCYKNSNGLTELAIPILLNGIHLTTLFSGYFFTAQPDIKTFEKEAQQYQFNEGQYRKAITETPLLALETVKANMLFFKEILEITLELAFDKKEQNDLNIALTTSNLFTQSIIDNSHAMVYVADLEGKFKLVNKQFATIFQRDKSEIVEKNREQIMPLAVAEEHRANDIKVIQSKKAITIEEANMEKDGEHFYISQKFPLFDINGNINGVGGISTDVTEKNKIKEALAKSEYKYKSLFENSADGIIVLNQHSEILELNAKICEILGYTRDELAAFKGFEIIHPDDLAAKDHNAALDILQKGNSILTQYRLQRKDGTFIYTELNTKMIGENQFLNIIRDITQRKEAEKALLEREKILSVIFNNHTDLQLLVSIDPECDFRVDAINKPYIDTGKAFGLLIDPKALIGQPIRVLNEAVGLDEVYYNNTIATYNKVISSGKPIYFTETISLSGQNYTSEITLSPIMDEQGKCQYILYNSHNITEQTKATNALFESEEKFKLIFRTSPDFVTINRLEDGEYVDVNDSFMQTSGYAREDIIGKTSKDLNIWSNSKDREIMISKLLETGKVENLEAQFTLKNGKIIDGLLSAALIVINQDQHLLTITRDITELKQAEQAFKETAANLSSMINNREDSIWSIDLDFNYIIFNSTYEKIINDKYSIQLKRGMSFTEKLTKDELNFWKPEFEAVFNGESVSFEFAHIINKELRYFHTSLHPIIEGHKITGASGLSIDVTKRKLIEEALKLSEEKFAKSFRLSPFLITLSSFEGEVIEVNDRIYSTLGYTREEFIGNNTTQLPLWVKPQERENFGLLLQKDHTLNEMEVQFRKKSGEIGDYFISACIIEVHGRPLYLTIVHDITQRKNAEKQIIELNTQLELKVQQRTAQLEAINKELETFSYSVSHDLKAPLRGIDGYSKLLLDIYRSDLKEEAQSFIDKIRRSTLQMNEIIDDLLDYSRLERSQLTISKLNVIDLINSVLSVHSFERNTGTIIFDPKEDNVTINADANGFIMAFRNLVENAIKFTKGQEHPIITIEIKDNNESWIVSVTDNGIGFDMQYHHKIFDIFQRLQRAEDYPGTGIGLALVNKAMQRMHGKTWAESSPNKGATFYLEIPKNQ